MLGNAVLFLLTSLGVGLFISTISQTQQQAMMSSFFFAMPCFMLSGFEFPIHNLPPAVQYMSLLNPLPILCRDRARDFPEEDGYSGAVPQTLALTVYGLAVMRLSALRFRKRLD